MGCGRRMALALGAAGVLGVVMLRPGGRPGGPGGVEVDDPPAGRVLQGPGQPAAAAGDGDLAAGCGEAGDGRGEDVVAGGDHHAGEPGGDVVVAQGEEQGEVGAVGSGPQQVLGPRQQNPIVVKARWLHAMTIWSIGPNPTLVA